MIRKIFYPPVFEQEEKNFRAKFINGFAWITILILLVVMAFQIFGTPKNFTIVVFSVLIIIMATALYLLHRGVVSASGMIIVILSWIGIGIQAYTADGVKDVILIAYLALGLFASIVVNWRVGGIIILSSIGVIWTLALLETNAFFEPNSQNPIDFARDLTFAFLAVAGLFYFSATSIGDATRRASTSEKDLSLSNQRLRELNQSLEDRIASRTAELEAANQRSERRARQFETIAQVVQATLAIQDEEALLSQLAQVISERFSFYHVGIFTLDGSRENVILRASNSEGGRKMLERRYALKISQRGIVSHVAASGNARVAPDVQLDPIFVDNPDLPETRCEMALPLRLEGEVIGILDIQGAESNAFQAEDIEMLSTLADQLAVAIQNVRSHEITQRLLEEAQRSSGSHIQESWRLLQAEEKKVGYFVMDNVVKPLETQVTSSQINQLISQSDAPLENDQGSSLAVPIRLHGEIVGIIHIRILDEHEMDPDNVDIAESVAERLSLALESATVLRSTQRRAEIERLTADISGKISASSQFDLIMRTAAEELSRALGGSEVYVQIQPETLENASRPITAKG
ncbi:MAG: GAF domain-containing protein, partial [Chloroflexi bacterium]